MERQQSGRLKSILLLALGAGLLLVLIAPHAAGHLPLAFLCLTFTPLFLFAALETAASSPFPDRTIAAPAAAQNARPALFQIPPPVPLT